MPRIEVRAVTTGAELFFVVVAVGIRALPDQSINAADVHWVELEDGSLRLNYEFEIQVEAEIQADEIKAEAVRSMHAAKQLRHGTVVYKAEIEVA